MIMIDNKNNLLFTDITIIHPSGNGTNHKPVRTQTTYMSIVLCNTKNNNLFLLCSPRADTETKNQITKITCYLLIIQ